MNIVFPSQGRAFDHRTLRAISAAAILVGAGAAQASTIYSNDFSANANGFSGFTSLSTLNGESFLGQLTLGADAALTVNTSGYSNVVLSFDLYTIQSLDGAPDNDAFKLIANLATLSDYNYTNDGHYSSTNPYTPSATGHLNTNFYGPDHTYRLSFNLGTPGASTLIHFIGNSNQGPSDEGFGIDNVLLTGNLSTTHPVPEPASWALMILGFGSVGAAMRSRRRSFVAA